MTPTSGQRTTIRRGIVMNVKSISGSWTPLITPSDAPPATTAPRTPVASDGTGWAGDQVEVAGAPILKEKAASSDEVRVAVHARDDGTLLVTLYDSASGQIIAQMPPEQVIAAIDEALQRSEKRK